MVYVQGESIIIAILNIYEAKNKEDLKILEATPLVNTIKSFFLSRVALRI